MCSQTVGTGWAAHGTGRCQKVPRKKRWGWDVPRPSLWLLKCGSRTRAAVNAVAGCMCRKLSPCVGGSCGWHGWAGGMETWVSGQPCFIWHGKTSSLLLQPLALCPGVPAAGPHPAAEGVRPYCVNPTLASERGGWVQCTVYMAGVLSWAPQSSVFLVLEPLCSSEAVASASRLRQAGKH